MIFILMNEDNIQLRKIYSSKANISTTVTFGSKYIKARFLL